jgi:cellulose synthase operon protein C
MRLVVQVGAVGLCLIALTPPSAFAADGEVVRPAAASETARIKPAAERKLTGVERPTIKKKAQQKAQAARGARVSLQIPERLRKALAAKIDRRIERNISQSKQLRVEAMALLSKFIDESPSDTPEMPEALLRMGELEWEDGRDKFLVAFQRWEKTPTDQRSEPPTPNYSKPRGRFLRVLKGYKSFSQYDLALYVDGFLANEEGKFEEALGRFNKIIEWFPKSRFIPDAHMVRAEYEFTKDAPNYETAFREYEQVLKFEDSDLYDLALFKSAWTLWRLGRTEEAAQRFLKVFQATEDGARNKGKSRRELDELQAEALKNLVAVFVEDERRTAPRTCSSSS